MLVQTEIYSSASKCDTLDLQAQALFGGFFEA
jgi:hypothetical protein